MDMGNLSSNHPRGRKRRLRRRVAALFFTLASTLAVVLATAAPAQAEILPGEHGFQDCSAVLSGEDGTEVFNLEEVAGEEGDNIFDTFNSELAAPIEVERVNITCQVVNNGTLPVEFRYDVLLIDSDGVGCADGAAELTVAANTSATFNLDQQLRCPDTGSFDLDRWSV